MGLLRVRLVCTVGLVTGSHGVAVCEGRGRLRVRRGCGTGCRWRRRFAVVLDAILQPAQLLGVASSDGIGDYW